MIPEQQINKEQSLPSQSVAKCPKAGHVIKYISLTLRISSFRKCQQHQIDTTKEKLQTADRVVYNINRAGNFDFSSQIKCK